MYSADAVYELKGNAELPVKNVRIKDVKVGSVKKFVKKVSNVENGYKIKVGISDVETIGIDTPQDLKHAEEFLKNRS